MSETYAKNDVAQKDIGDPNTDITDQDKSLFLKKK